MVAPYTEKQRSVVTKQSRMSHVVDGTEMVGESIMKLIKITLDGLTKDVQL